jgi:anaerobic carbon-monoxide dehydrogenase iron sulfur subunit
MSYFIAIDHEHCTGCKACEMVCSLYHFGECNPWKSAIRVIRKEQGGLVFSLPIVCQHCEAAHCAEACPTGALSRDEGQNMLILDRGLCVSCGLCFEACPARCVPVDSQGAVVTVCDLCAGQPQCVAACHARCLTKVDSREARERQNVESLAKILEQEGLWSKLPARRS